MSTTPGPVSACDVAIIGGGISGLACAFELQHRGLRPLVLERQARPGGNAISERIAPGFLMEHGPSTISMLCDTALGFSAKLALDGERCPLGAGVRKRYLVRHGRLAGISAHPLGFLASSYLSPRARLRLLAEILMPHMPAGPGTRDETVAAFFSRRFGSEFAERIIDPLVAGIYSGRACELSMRAVFPRLVALETRHGSVLAGLLRRRPQRGRMPGSRLFSWISGVGTLPHALARHLGSRLRCGILVRSIHRIRTGFAIDLGEAGTLRARAVILATQPHVAAALLEPLDAPASDAAGAIAAPPLAVAFLGYRREHVGHPLDGLGFLTAQSEGRTLIGAQFCSTMFPGRAPHGHVALAAYFGGVRAPDVARLPTRDILALARDEFSDLLAAKGEPVVARVRHWPLGLPQYALGHGARRAILETANTRCPGLHVTGNYLSGPSVAACLEQAVHTARRAAQALGARATAAPTPAGLARSATACG